MNTKQTKLHFWGGLDTIGGNILEVRYNNSRVIFDFGRAYDPSDTILTNAKGREASRVADMLKLGLLPKIDGIYSKKDVEDLIPAEEDTFETAIFISHLHLDHFGNVDAPAPSVPIYMSNDGKELLLTLMELGEPPFAHKEALRGMEYEKPVQIGDITVTCYLTDHDVHGSTAMLIETPEIKIAFSGDIRLHGPAPETTRHWMAEMRAKTVDYLLMEGTTFFPPAPEGEPVKEFVQIYENDLMPMFTERLAETAGLGIFNIYHTNIHRLQGILNLNRTVVLEPATAKIAAKFLPQAKFLVLGQDITPQEINQNPGQYFLQNSFANVLNLIDYNLEDSLYIHSNGTPLGAFDPNYGSLLAFLQKLGVKYEYIGLSGHGNKEAVLEIIDQVAPKVMVPWHSKSRGTMIPKNLDQIVLMVEEGKWYTHGEF